MAKRISTRDARMIGKHILTLDPFKTHGALEGRETQGCWDSGRLPSEYLDSFLSADYAIYSYATPIAWYINGMGWVMADARYSLTTTRHQSTVRYAMTLASELKVA